MADARLKGRKARDKDAGKRARHDDGETGAGLSDEQTEVVEERIRPPTTVIYEIISQEGEEEMRRPLTSLWWSGIAAGLAIGFSLVAKAILMVHLPDAPWQPLVSNFGYSVGFIMVILGRQQLFTENTVTPILPLAASFSLVKLWRVARLWGVVFAANMVGTFCFALFNALLPGTLPDVAQAMMAISQHLMEKSWFAMGVSAIGAGFLMATIVWLLPSAEAAKFHVILLLSYLIGIAGFAHIVAGSTEAFLLVLTGKLGAFEMLWHFTLPTLAGNIIGGTALFALVAYGQVVQELEQ